MRPTPQEIINGVRALLRDSVGPTVTDKSAAAALKRIMVALRDANWNEAAFDLMRETHMLAALAGRAHAWAAERPDSQTLSRSLSEARASAAGADTFAACNAANHVLRQALAEFIAFAARHDDAAPLRDDLVRTLATLSHIKIDRF